ncbi:MAG: hypothetical protein K2X27_15970 [Candidatus Obscuribacterales bacterium]|nr:hypothetical protein [Candidatus Obscuribacterales bacterium]
MARFYRRKKTGTSIAEAAASMVLMIPLIILLTFVIWEVSYTCFLINNLSQASRLAARSMAISYGADPKIVDSRAAQDSIVFDQIRIPNIVNDSAQFDDPVFQTTTEPHTVRIKVRYLGGQHSLPPFPHPDPLNLQSRFQPVAESTFRLE